MAHKIALYSKNAIHPKLCFEGDRQPYLKCNFVSKIYL